MGRRDPSEVNKLIIRRSILYILVGIFGVLIVNTIIGVLLVVAGVSALISLVTALILSIVYIIFVRYKFYKYIRNGLQINLIKAKAISKIQTRVLAGALAFAIAISTVVNLANEAAMLNTMNALHGMSILSILDRDKDGILFNWGYKDYGNPNSTDPTDPNNGEYEGNILVRFALAEWKEYFPNGQPTGSSTQVNNNAAKRGGGEYVDWRYNRSSSSSIAGSTEDWCADFASYCVQMCHLADDGGPFKDIFSREKCLGTCSSGGAWSWYGAMTNTGIVSHKYLSEYTPQPGDIALFSRNAGDGGSAAGHIGIVEKIEGDTLYVIEGNRGPSCPSTSCVRKMAYPKQSDSNGEYFKENWSGGRYIYIFHPNYKQSNNGPGGYIGTHGFDIRNYTDKDSKGYYTKKALEEIVFDYCVLELGYNPAIACGFIGNVVGESGSSYDVVEATDDGLAYDPSGKSYRVPTRTGNGNYIGTDFESIKLRDEQDVDGIKWHAYIGRNYKKYGMGYGIIQWSFGRRVALMNIISASGMSLGPDTIVAQLQLMHKELTDADFNHRPDIQNANYQNVGARIATTENTLAGAKSVCTELCNNYIQPGGNALPHRLNATEEAWNKYKDRVPAKSGGGSNNNNDPVTPNNVDISGVTIIGDSNTVRMVNNGTAINSARKVLAIVGVGVGSYKTTKVSDSGSCTSFCSNKTLEMAITACSSDDLKNVMIMLGTNDFSSSESSFKSNYKSLLDLIKRVNSNASVVLCTVPRVNDSKSSTIKDADAAKISGYIKSLAGEYTGLSIKVLDVYSYLSTSDMSTANGDGYHLSSAGCTKCANYMVQNCSFGSGASNNGGESFIFPLNKAVNQIKVTSNVGSRNVSGGSSNHYGIDLAASNGQDVIATKSGKVISSAWSNPRGYYMVVSHGPGCTSLYQHLSDNKVVSVGSTVNQGQVIAKSGNSGVNTNGGAYAYHLHFELMVNNRMVNPLKYLPTGWIKGFSGDDLRLDWEIDPRSVNTG